MRSGELPAGNGTTSLIGLAGHDCANDGTASDATLAAADCRTWRRRMTDPSVLGSRLAAHQLFDRLDRCDAAFENIDDCVSDRHLDAASACAPLHHRRGGNTFGDVAELAQALRQRTAVRKH